MQSNLNILKTSELYSQQFVERNNVLEMREGNSYKWLTSLNYRKPLQMVVKSNVVPLLAS